MSRNNEVSSNEEIETIVASNLDNSGSMKDQVPIVINFYNELRAAILGAASADSIALGLVMLHGGLTFPFEPVKISRELDGSVYQPNGLTPLYDSVVQFLDGIDRTIADARANGTRLKSVAFFISDGVNNEGTTTLDEVRARIAQVDRSTTTIFAFAWNASVVPQLEAMGLDPKTEIIDGGKTPAELRKALGFLSMSVTNAASGIPASAGATQDPAEKVAAVA